MATSKYFSGAIARRWRLSRLFPVGAALLPVLLIPLLVDSGVGSDVGAETATAETATAETERPTFAVAAADTVPQTVPQDGVSDAADLAAPSVDVAATSVAEQSAAPSADGQDAAPADAAADVIDVSPLALSHIQSQRPLADLSVEAVTYLAGREGSISVAVLDLGSGDAYSFEAGQRHVVASIFKLPLLLAVLERVEVSGVELTRVREEQTLAMIAWSANLSTDALIDWLGGFEQVQAYLDGLGVGAPWIVVDESWGQTSSGALDIAALFAELGAGPRISEAMRERVFDLLALVVPEQRWGVSSGFDAPDGEGDVALKNGWYPGDEGWRVNSAGIVRDGEGVPRYVIVVMTGEQPEFEYGVETVEAVSRRIHNAFNPIAELADAAVRSD